MTITDTRTEPATTAGSAYPPSIADLMPRARKLAETEGGLPSRNRVMTTLKVGAPKARQILAGLAAEGYEPTTGPGLQTTKAEPVAEPAPVTEPVGPSPVPVKAAGAGTVPETIEPAASETTVDESADAEIASVATVPAGPSTVAPPVEASQATTVTDPGTKPQATAKRIVAWPVWLLMLPASVAIWSGWVGLGELSGFGPVNLLPGIANVEINTAITLPIGMEVYSAYALYVWLSGRASAKAIKFARISAIAGLIIGGAGQIAYHLMAAANVPAAHPLITAAVACIPVAVLGMGAALAHLVKNDHTDK